MSIQFELFIVIMVLGISYTLVLMLQHRFYLPLLCMDFHQPLESQKLEKRILRHFSLNVLYIRPVDVIRILKTDLNSPLFI